MFSASQSECKNLIKTLVALRYYPDNKPWDGELIRNPSWEQVESVIRRMDDFCFPLVALSLNSCLAVSDVFEDDDSFHVIGGNDCFALFQNAGNWQYDNPYGSADSVRLWQSDQGYFCEQRNIATLRTSLALIREFYLNGNFEAVELSAGNLHK